MGAFKWKSLGLDYDLDETPVPSPEIVGRVLAQFRDAGCRAR
jgi:pyruvate formate lyase activating enzyme